MQSGNNSKTKLLIVDDEVNIRRSLELLLQENYEVITAEDGLDAIEKIESSQPDLILLDVAMPRCDGIETLKKLASKNLTYPVVMLTGNSTVQTAVEAMKLGASDFVSKPFNVQELANVIVATLARSLSNKKTKLEKSETRPIPKEEHTNCSDSDLSPDFGAIVGKSQSMQRLYEIITSVSLKNANVLITGESGTGKELVARQIHNLSARKQFNFVALNCAAIPENLIESELFGHEKGSFTGAQELRRGFCELADSGTLFLDEIGDLSLNVQVKLLRFLQEQEFYRVGGSKPIKVNARVLAATNKNLEKMVKEGTFREDLYYRINVVHIKIPSLKDRFDDIPHLLDYFIQKHSQNYLTNEVKFTLEAKQACQEYTWPGNVRELENTVESILALADTNLIDVCNLPRKITQIESNEFIVDRRVFEGSLSFEEAERAFESEIIMKALKRSNYVQTRAAELLGISRRILKYKMDKLGISESFN
jgi:two-component system response regulator AtoC